MNTEKVLMRLEVAIDLADKLQKQITLDNTLKSCISALSEVAENADPSSCYAARQSLDAVEALKDICDKNRVPGYEVDSLIHKLEQAIQLIKEDADEEEEEQ